MVGIARGYSEMIRFSAVDYFTGEILIDTYVQPRYHIVDWRTKYSGVSAGIFNEARAQGKVLESWEHARMALWSCIDADTILIGQALNNDIEMLRVIHSRIVDSALLAKKVVGPDTARAWSLKTLCSELLGREIQNRGKKGHDSVEDCLATREVVLWMTSHPEEFEQWGKLKKEEERVKREEQKKKQLEEQAKKAAEKAKKREEEQGQGPLTEELMAYHEEMLLDLGYYSEDMVPRLDY